MTVTVGHETTPQQLERAAAACGFSRLPVTGPAEEVLGYLHIRRAPSSASWKTSWGNWSAPAPPRRPEASQQPGADSLSNRTAVASTDLTRRVRLRRAALEVFAEPGRRVTSPQAVAAGRSAALVTRHFGSKQGLCAATAAGATSSESRAKGNTKPARRRIWPGPRRDHTAVCLASGSRRRGWGPSVLATGGPANRHTIRACRSAG